VLWPVFVSPHYKSIKPGAPLEFGDYVNVGPGMVRWGDAPDHVRQFPLTHPELCETSNDLQNSVQFLTSADMHTRVVAPPGKHAPLSEQIAGLGLGSAKHKVWPGSYCSPRHGHML
jgi:hypothetical protein